MRRRHFGKEVITATDPSLSSDVIDRLYMKMYESFVQAIDGIDNGVPLYPASAGEPAYSSKTDLSSRVGYLNPRWNQQADEAEYMARFEKASKMAGEEFFDRLDYAIHAWIPALNIVLEAVQKRKQAAGGDPQGRLIIFEDFANWKVRRSGSRTRCTVHSADGLVTCHQEHLFNLEKELNIPEAEKPLYILYPDESGKWRIQAVPESPSSFASRKALPEPWRGIRDEELSKLSGIPGCIFVHQSGFIGGECLAFLAFQRQIISADHGTFRQAIKPREEPSRWRTRHWSGPRSGNHATCIIYRFVLIARYRRTVQCIERSPVVKSSRQFCTD